MRPRRKRRDTQRSNGKPPLAIISEEERQDYANRMSMVVSKRTEAIAAASYLDALGEELKVKYGLPSRYDLNLQTGVVTESITEMEAS